MMPGVDWGASGRVDSYSAYIVDLKTLEDIAPIDIVPEKCSVTWGYYTDNLYTAKVVVRGWWDYGCNHLVRIYHRCRIGAYDSEEPIATLFVDAAPLSAVYGEETTELSCYSTLYRFTQDRCIADYKAAKGDDILARITALVEGKGGVLAVDPDTAGRNRRLSADHFWEIDTAVSTILADMAGWLGAQVGCDGWGRITLRPYVEPSKKAVTFSFDDADSIFKNGIQLTNNRGDICNVAVAYYSEKDAKPIRREARLADSEPFSQKSIGRQVPIISKLTDKKFATSAAVAAEAVRLLRDNSGLIEYYEIEHAGCPEVAVGDVVSYRNGLDASTQVAVDALVTEMDCSLVPGMMTKTKLKSIREIAYEQD